MSNLEIGNSASLFGANFKMKKTILLSAVFLSSLFATQSFAGDDRKFKPFKVDVMAGYAIPSAKVNKGAVAFSVEPKYGFTDNFFIGLRLDGTVISSQRDPFIGLGIPSVLLTTEYAFLITDKFKVFGGLGLGNYSYFPIFKNSDKANVKTLNKFGFCPRVGLEYDHFRFAIEYNIIDEFISTLAFKIGFGIGGGAKD